LFERAVSRKGAISGSPQPLAWLSSATTELIYYSAGQRLSISLSPLSLDDSWLWQLLSLESTFESCSFPFNYVHHYSLKLYSKLGLRSSLFNYFPIIIEFAPFKLIFVTIPFEMYF